MLTRFFATIALLCTIVQSANATSIDEQIDKYFAPFSDTFSKIFFTSITISEIKVPILILLLIVASIICTVYLRGICIWGFKYSLKQIFKRKVEHNATEDNKDGEVSTLGALATALSGTIGLGSIAGVAIAISVGGPGAMFWMCIGAIFGMALKFCEVTLALKYRRFNADGTVSGGPMFYIAHGLTRKGLRWLGQPMALFFAIMTVPGALGGGCMLQINQATRQFINITGGENSFFYNHAWVCGAIVAILVCLTIIGGIKSIAKVTSKIVPTMCGIYVISALIIIFINVHNIPNCIATILKEAFFPQSVAGGIIGTIIMSMRRSIQSNEAGSGSGPIAYAAVKTKEPISQGLVALIEPFLVTAVICSMTALVIIITGQYQNFTQGMTGVELTSAAFASVFSFFPFILAIVIILFAISTIISWAYYGQKAWNYMFGEGIKRTRTYQIMFCGFIIVGSSMNLSSVVNFTDATMLAMALPNLIAIFIMLKEIKEDLILYCKKHGINNVFIKPWLKEDEKTA